MVEVSKAPSSGPLGTFTSRRERVVREGVQHNLVLDQVYDLIGVYGLTSLARYAVVSSYPSYLELSRETRVFPGEIFTTDRDETNSMGGSFSVRELSPLRYEVRVVREFSEEQVGGKSLLFWGFSPEGEKSPPLAFAEVFRDLDGNPSPLYLEEDQRLRLVYAYEFSLSSLAGSSLEVFGGKGGEPKKDFSAILSTGSSTSGSGEVFYHALLFMDSFLSSAKASPYQVLASAKGVRYFHEVALLSGGSALFRKPLERLPYVFGSCEASSAPIVFNSYEGNGEIEGVAFGFVESEDGVLSPCYTMTFQSPIHKDNLHKLILGSLRVSWSN